MGEKERKPDLLAQYRRTRQLTESLCAPLVAEDYVLQAMPDVSPPKWHLAHTSWFFETFLLTPHSTTYQVFHPQYGFLFNSYYEGIGPRQERPRRGLLSRPTTEEIYRYRAHVDSAMQAFLEEASEPFLEKIAPLIHVGIHHEQQHQELLLTDIKYNFYSNPLRPSYRLGSIEPSSSEISAPLEWISYPKGVREIGNEGKEFVFDNETPRHEILLGPYRLGSRLITNGEYLEFIENQGYQHSDLWLSDGWATIRQEGWQAPLYWEKKDKDWFTMTFAGMKKINLDEPVSHVSYYEADAFARWSGKRLPTEAEWEAAAQKQTIEGNFLESEKLHPTPALSLSSSQPTQMFGDTWEWTQSAYLPYPGYRPYEGTLGEYNQKFMCNQMVLRGGSCLTPQSHIRATYRNFFYPSARWQVTGIRLADNL